MKIKRFFAADMRQAIRKVREEQGPDAVILSNRKVDGGVEIVSAIDYDEAAIDQALAREENRTRSTSAPKPVATSAYGSTVSVKPRMAQPKPANETYSKVQTRRAQTSVPKPVAPAQEYSSEARTRANQGAPSRRDEISWAQDPALLAMKDEIKELRDLLQHQLAQLTWGDLSRNHPQQVELLRRLNSMGMKPAYAQHLAQQVSTCSDLEQAWRTALGLFAQSIPVCNDDILDFGGVVALVGATGVGKTTTVAKLAARYAMRHGAKRVALVTTDNYRIGAHEQLLTYGKILGVPVHMASDHAELQQILKSLMDKHLVLIDTAGMSQRDLRLSEQFNTLRNSGMPIRTYLVMSSTAQALVQEETIRAFQAVDLDGCILTKVDETASLGGALSVISEQQLSLAYVADGQRVPEDIQPARPQKLVHLAAQMCTDDEWSPGETVLAETFGEVAANVHV